MQSNKKWFKTVCWIVLVSFCFQLIPKSALAQTYFFPKPINEKTFPIQDLGIFSDNFGLGLPDIQISEEPSTPFVFLISEAHANPAFQKQIVRLLNRIDNRFGLDAIFVEGTHEKLLTETYGPFSDKEKFRKYLQELLDKGRLTGAEYYSLMNKKGKLGIWGTEDPVLYHYSLKTMQKIYRAHENWDRIKPLLKASADKEIVVLSKNVRNLFEIFETHFRSAREFDLQEGLSKVQKALDQAKVAPQDLRRINNEYRELFEFARNSVLLNRANQIDPRELVHKTLGLVPYLSSDQKRELFEKIARSKNQNSPVFYRWLYEFLRQENLKQIPQNKVKLLLEDLNILLHVPEKMNQNLAEIFIQLHHLKWETVLLLADDEKEKQYLEKLNLLFWMNRLIQLKITSYEWKSFFQDGLFFENWEDLLPGLNAQNRSVLNSLIQDAVTFYQAARSRDVILTANLVEKAYKLKSQNRVVALVVGGFHEKGVAKTLDALGVRYASILPYPEEMPRGGEEFYRKLILEQDFLAPMPILSPSHSESFEFANQVAGLIPEFGQIKKSEWDLKSYAKAQERKTLEQIKRKFSGKFLTEQEERKILHYYLQVGDLPDSESADTPEKALALSIKNWVRESSSNRKKMLVGIHKRVVLYEQMKSPDIRLGIGNPKISALEVLSDLGEKSDEFLLKQALTAYFKLDQLIQEVKQSRVRKKVTSKHKRPNGARSAVEKRVAPAVKVKKRRPSVVTPIESRRSRESGKVDIFTLFVSTVLIVGMFVSWGLWTRWNPQPSTQPAVSSTEPESTTAAADSSSPETDETQQREIIVNRSNIPVTAVQGTYNMPYGGYEAVSINRNFRREEGRQNIQARDLLIGLTGIPNGQGLLDALNTIDVHFALQKNRIIGLLSQEVQGDNTDQTFLIVRERTENPANALDTRIARAVGNVQTAVRAWQDQKAAVDSHSQPQMTLVPLERTVQARFAELEVLLVERGLRRVRAVSPFSIREIRVSENQALSNAVTLFEYDLPYVSLRLQEVDNTTRANLIFAQRNHIRVFLYPNGSDHGMEVTDQILRFITAEMNFELTTIPDYDLRIIFHSGRIRPAISYRLKIITDQAIDFPTVPSHAILGRATFNVSPYIYPAPGQIQWNREFPLTNGQTHFRANQTVLGTFSDTIARIGAVEQSDLQSRQQSLTQEADSRRDLVRDPASLYGVGLSDPRDSESLQLRSSILAQQANMLPSLRMSNIVVPAGIVQANLEQITDHPDPSKPLFYFLPTTGNRQLRIEARTMNSITLSMGSLVTVHLPNGKNVEGVVESALTPTESRGRRNSVQELVILAKVQASDFPDGLPDMTNGTTIYVTLGRPEVIQTQAPANLNLLSVLLGLFLLTGGVLSVRKFISFRQMRENTRRHSDTYRRLVPMIFLFLVLGQAGCATQSDYERRTAQITGPHVEERRQSVINSTLYVPGNLQNLTPDQAVRYAILSSPELLSQLFKSHELYSRLRQSTAEDVRLSGSLGARFSLGAQFLGQTQGVPSVNVQTGNTWASILAGVQFNLTATSGRFQDASLRLMAHDLYFMSQVDNLILRTRLAYYGLAEAQLQLNRAQVGLQETQSRLAALVALQRQNSNAVAATDLQTARAHVSTSQTAVTLAQGNVDLKAQELRALVAPGSTQPLSLPENLGVFYYSSVTVNQMASMLGVSGIGSTDPTVDLPRVKQVLIQTYPGDTAQINAISDFQGLRIFLERKILGSTEADRHTALAARIPSLSIPVVDPPTNLVNSNVNPQLLLQQNASAVIQNMITLFRDQARTQVTFSIGPNFRANTASEGITLNDAAVTPGAMVGVGTIVEAILGFFRLDFSVPLDTTLTDLRIQELETQLARFRVADLPGLQNSLQNNLRLKAIAYQTQLNLVRQRLREWKNAQDALALALGSLGRQQVDLAAAIRALRLAELQLSLDLMSLQRIWGEIESASGRTLPRARELMQQEIQHYERTSGTGTRTSSLWLPSGTIRPVEFDGTIFRREPQSPWHAKGEGYTDPEIDAVLKEKFANKEVETAQFTDSMKLASKLNDLLSELDATTLGEIVTLLGVEPGSDIKQVFLNKINNWLGQSKIYFAKKNPSLFLTTAGMAKWQAVHIGFFKGPSIYLTEKLFESLGSSDARESRAVLATLFYELYKLDAIARGERSEDEIQATAKQLETLVAGFDTTEEFYKPKLNEELKGPLKAESVLDKTPPVSEGDMAKLLSMVQEGFAGLREEIKTEVQQAVAPLAARISALEKYYATRDSDDGISAPTPSSDDSDLKATVKALSDNMIKLSEVVVQGQKELKKELKSAKEDNKELRNEQIQTQREVHLDSLTRKLEDRSFFVREEIKNLETDKGIADPKELAQVLEYRGITK